MTEGELWARGLLEKLQEGGYRPRAWSVFVGRSFDRASQRRRERWRAHRQAVLLGAAGLAAWGAVALAGRPSLGAAGAAFWLLVVLMLDWHLGMLERSDGRPLNGLGVANALTLLRTALVPALAVLPARPLAAALFAAGVLDAVDGPLARARDETTRLGFWLDGVADGLVLGTAAVAGARAGLLPWWAAALVVARHALPWAAIAVVYLARAEAPRRDGAVSGRLPGLVLFTGLVLAMLGAPGALPLVAVGAVGGLATLGATAYRWIALAGLVVALAGCGSHAARTPPPSTPDLTRIGGQSLYSTLRDLERGWRTDFRHHTVPLLLAFENGGPGKDGIPALFHPHLAPAREIRFLPPQAPVIELVVRGLARAYPLQVLVWHEIANDALAGVPVAVTFCPLCNTALVFDRRVGGHALSFGTTGNLYSSDLVMYDRQTESWWLQFGGEGIVGRYAGARLRQLPARIVGWAEFRRAHPDGLVLTRRTGYRRRYGDNPYAGYENVNEPPLFATAHEDDRRLPPRERVVFVDIGHESAAIPFSTLARRHEVRITVGGRPLVVQLGAAGADTSIVSKIGAALSPRACEHVPAVHAPARADTCEECGSRSNLRVCSTCGHVGCCDSQAGHARIHWQKSGHPVMRAKAAFGSGFIWCYPDNAYVSARGDADRIGGRLARPG